MKEKGYGADYAKLEEFYVQRLIDLLGNVSANVGRSNKKHEFIVWQEVFDNGVEIDDQTIVHVWEDWAPWQKELFNVTKAGHRAILSSCWYLNYISYGSDWTKVSVCDGDLDVDCSAWTVGSLEIDEIASGAVNPLAFTIAHGPGRSW